MGYRDEESERGCSLREDDVFRMQSVRVRGLGCSRERRGGWKKKKRTNVGEKQQICKVGQILFPHRFYLSPHRIEDHTKVSGEFSLSLCHLFFFIFSLSSCSSEMNCFRMGLGDWPVGVWVKVWGLQVSSRVLVRVKHLGAADSPIAGVIWYFRSFGRPTGKFFGFI